MHLQRARGAGGVATPRWARIAPFVAVALGATLLAFVAVPPAAAASATFDPVTSSSLGPGSVFGQVVAGGGGEFHAVARTSFLGVQRVTYHRSVDGGRTWAIRNAMEGSNGGATRPSIAAHGDDVAIGFIGSWCDPTTAPPVCGEAPYLTTSQNAGQTWSPPLRLGRQAFDIRVAVDRGRTWVTWETGGNVEVRGTLDDGHTFFVDRTIGGRLMQLAARDGVMVVALQGTNSPQGPVIPIAAVADGEALGPFVPLGDDTLDFASWTSGVAAADGRVHVLLRETGGVPPGTSPRLLVVSAGADGVFADPVAIGAAGYSGSIAATRGTVGVAVGMPDGLTSVATSADGGVTFSALVPVSATPGGEPLVELGAMVPAYDRPVVRFDWSVPERYRDEGSDGLPDPANVSGDPSLDGLRVYANRTLEVRLDGCASVPPPGRTIQVYSWYVDGQLHDAGSCTTTLDVDDGASVAVRLTVEDDLGLEASITQDVAPQDLVVVSMGDSVASGEGSPHIDASLAVPAAWQDGPCHRSAHAGPALAARRLEAADPRTSVTFIQLACSGAAMLDTAEVPGTDLPGDDPDTGGVLDAYHGVRPASGSLRPSQFAQLAELLGTRSVDALMLSVGANDIRFSDVVEGCLLQPSCETSAVQTTFDARVGELPARYAQVAAATAALGIASDRVLLSEYFDPTTADAGLPDMRCTLDSGEVDILDDWSMFDLALDLVAAASDGGLLDDDEAIWARNHVIRDLNAAGVDAAAAHGWTYVGGIADRFAGRGYCATDHAVVRLGESLLGQANPDGAFHPNRAGQQVYGDALFAPLRARLTLPAPVGGGGPVVGSRSLGDLAVVTTSRTTVTTASVRSTGGAPLPGVVRQLDRLVSGDGFVGPGGPPAVDRNAAVGAWTELSGYGNYTTQSLVAQLGTHPNVGVDSVRVVQAPADGTRVVAGRDSVVLATIDASSDGPVTVDVTTAVSAVDDLTGDEYMLFPPVTEAVELRPGRNDLLLPTDQVFQPEEGTVVQATVTVTDPQGATADDEWDNTGEAIGPNAPTAIAGRSPHVAFGRLDVGASTVGCVTVGTLASNQIAFAGAAMPVAGGNVDASLFCQPIPSHAHSEEGVLDVLVDLDEQARYAALDAVVAVVPAGWLSSVAGGAIGVSAAGLRAVVLEAGSPPHTLAHELTHSLGEAGHTDGPVPAFGARVDRNELREGVDWMLWRTPPQVWTGGTTWDALFDLIGGPQDAPVPLVLDGNGYWIRGAVESPPGQPPRLTSDPLLPDDSDASPPPGSEGDDSRVTATPLDAAGDPVGPPEPITLSAAEGLYGETVGTEPGPVGWTFAEHLVLDDGVAAIRLELDGVVVATRVITTAPTVTVTAPSSGDVIGRGAPLTIDWTIDDPDSAEHTSSVLVSDDAGASWRPLISGLTGTTTTLPLPADVGGPDVRVRVVVSDGTRLGTADSATFSAEPVGGVQDRLVFEVTNPTHAIVIRTSALDGTDVQAVPLPAEGYVVGCGTPCPAKSTDPAWSPDGSRIYFVSTLDSPDDPLIDPETGLPPPWTRNIWSVAPDGSGLRRESQPPWDDDFWRDSETYRAVEECPTVSPTGDGLAWSASLRPFVAELGPDGWTDARELLEPNGQGEYVYDASVLNDTWPVPTGGAVTLTPQEPCPTFSPDGDELALVVVVSYSTTAPDGSPRTFQPGEGITAVVTAPVDGSAPPSVVSPFGTMVFDGYYGTWRPPQLVLGQDWAPDGSILLTMVERVQDGFGSRAMHEVRRLDPSTGATSAPLGPPYSHGTQSRVVAENGPGGAIFGTRPGGGMYWYPERCGWWLLDPATGVPDIVATESVSAPDECWDDFDWAAVGEPGEPRLAVDPDAAPDDPNAPIPPADVTEPSVPSPDAAPGADDPVGVVPIAVDVAITIPAGQTTVVQLSTADGTLAPFDVVDLPPPDELQVGVPGAAPGPLRTRLDGAVVLTPGPGFTGTATFHHRVVGSEELAVANVTVAGPTSPDAADDELTLPADDETELDPSVLLANDTTGDGPILEIVSVYGSTSGRTWLDADGTLHVRTADAGTSTFTYVVADGAGATDTATVTVHALGTPTTTTTTGTPPPPPPPPTTGVGDATPICDDDATPPYRDVPPSNVHAPAISCVTALGIARGLGDGDYAPAGAVSRAQMASFLVRLLRVAGVELPSSPPDAFPGDAAWPPHELAIGQLAALGLLDGSTGQIGDAYAGAAAMRRDDMAQLLANAYALVTGAPLADGPDRFGDDDTSDNERAIDALAAAGVVNGTGPGRYDPGGSVSRAQMASFLTRLLLLFSAEGTAVASIG